MMMRLVKVRLVNGEERPLKEVFVHIDIAGEDQIEYQHFQTDEEGYVVQDERTVQLLEGDYHLIATWIPEDDRLMLGYPSQSVTIAKGTDIVVPDDKIFSAPSPEFVENKEELEKLKEIYREKEAELLVHLQEKEMTLDSELAALRSEKSELEEYETKLREEYEKVWDDEEDVKAQKIRIEMERRELTERETELQEAMRGIAEARERIIAARDDVNKSVGMLEEERRKIFDLSEQVESVNRDKDDYLAELKQRIDDADAISLEAMAEKERVMEGQRHLEKGRDRLEQSRKELDMQGQRLFDLIAHTQTGIRDQVEELEGKLKRRRSALINARQVLLEGRKKINDDRVLLSKGQQRIKELTEEGKNIIAMHMKSYQDLVETERER